MTQARSERLVALVDDELSVAKQMSKTDLMLFFRPALLRAEAVRDPGVGTKGAQEFLDRHFAASRVAHEISVVAVMEHPQPPAPLADAKAGFVRADRGSLQKTGADGLACGPKAGARLLQDIDDCAFADVDAQEVAHQRGQALEPDALREPEIDYEGAQVGAVWRSRLQSFRRLGLEAAGATRADAAVQDHPRHIGLDLGDFNPVIGLARLLRGLRYVGATVLAGPRQNVASLRGVGMQGPVRAGVRLALGPILGPGRWLLT